MSGKTTFVVDCLKYRESLFTTVFEEIYYFLPADQFSNGKLMDELKESVPGIKFFMGLPNQTHVNSARDAPKVSFFYLLLTASSLSITAGRRNKAKLIIYIIFIAAFYH